ncbi:hypothetical protein N185_01630 [Sinorhizobium sp. GW3]|nr:hypothetical protein N185_01630 [Sinorhizobium sp. GW3]
MHGGDSRGELSGGIFRLVSEPARFAKPSVAVLLSMQALQLKKRQRFKALLRLAVFLDGGALARMVPKKGCPCDTAGE